MYGQLPKGYIIKIDGERIYLDLHAPDVKVSDKVSVHTTGGVITHPVTKKQIRTEGEAIGTIEITQVYEEYSVGRALPDATSTLKEGMEVRKATIVAVDNNHIHHVHPINFASDENHEEDNHLSEKDENSMEKVSTIREEKMETKLSSRERAERLKYLRTFAKKGTKVFIQINCWDDSNFEQVFLTEFGRRKIWEIVDRPQDADFMLSVQGIPRITTSAYGDLTMYDVYALIFDEKERLLWRSNLYSGGKTIWSDFLKKSCEKFVKKALRTDVPNARDVYDGRPDILGINKVSTEKYNASEAFFWQGVDLFNQYNYKDAVKLFTEALRRNPHHALALKYRAIAYNHLLKYKKAKNDIKTAMKLDPFCMQNDSIYANIMYRKNEKDVRVANKYLMIAGIAGAMTQSLSVAASGGKVQPVASAVPVATNTAGRSVAANTGRQTCSSCNGTGKNSARERPALYNYSTEDYSSPRCSICGDRSNHYHKDCPSCMGKGYR
jgi:hypothetical protein